MLYFFKCFWVYHIETHYGLQADFDKKCPVLSECKSDLSIKVDMFLADDGRDTVEVDNDTTIHIGNLNKLQVITYKLLQKMIFCQSSFIM